MPSIDHAPTNFNLTSGGNLGAMEIATFISLALCGIVVAQGYSYYHHFTTDRPFLKIMVGAVLALEVSHSIATAYAIYDFTITLAAVAVTPADTNALSTAILLETLITAIVQSFFAYRIRSLSGNLYISSLSWILCFLRFLGGIVLTVKGFLDISRESFLDVYLALEDTFGWLITLTLSIGAAADLIIAASLCYYLNRLMSPVTMRRTAQIVDRLISWTIQTGLVTSMASVAAVICFQVMKHNWGIWMAIYTVLAKLYSNSLLLSLNLRMVNRAPPTMSKSATLEVSWNRSDSSRLSIPDTQRPSLRFRLHSLGWMDHTSIITLEVFW
ncbi:hypothetical protein BD779DRAFT_1122766 [Infundibulicybe gibba]|nr:hypothetical protein BD779DRAFT_1122766 [Infundibulicybe gibba]